MGKQERIQKQNAAILQWMNSSITLADSFGEQASRTRRRRRERKTSNPLEQGRKMEEPELWLLRSSKEQERVFWRDFDFASPTYIYNYNKLYEKHNNPIRIEFNERWRK